jgi:ElaA protein
VTDTPVGVRVASFAELDVHTAYQLWRLRVDVFVVEQACAYHELDGRDLEPATRHVWAERNGAVLGCLRVLEEPDGSRRIGRVCVALHARGEGWAGRLVQQAIELSAGHHCVLDAQAHLTGWYAQRGFAPTGPEFLDDGIPHVPMALVPG